MNRRDKRHREQPGLFDDGYHPEQAARDAACYEVAKNAGEDWADAVAGVLDTLDVDSITGEDLRLVCLARGIAPHHHNAWGGMVLRLVRQGRLVPTGEERAMKAPGSHGRRTRIYTIRKSNV